MHCLYCHEKLIVQTSWEKVFFPNEETKLCHKCMNNLHKLKGSRCHKCSRENDESLCFDCKRWQDSFEKGDPLIRNISLYKYNEFMQQLIAKWKYRGDYILGKCFKNEFIALFKKHFGHIANSAVIVPIPLSEERLFERGFNQAEMLASFISDELIHCLERVHTEKQSKKTRRERMLTLNPFILRTPINKRIILVDDIYTTGRTLRHAAHLLKENGCPEVYAITLIRG